MLNYRLVTMLLLIGCIVIPLGFHWAALPGGSWLRPYVVWLLFIVATYIWRSRGEQDDP